MTPASGAPSSFSTASPEAEKSPPATHPVQRTDPAPEAGRRRRRRAVPEGIRITRIGLWYILFSVLIGVAASNTGNNALYIVLAVMLGFLVVSGVVSRRNLRPLLVGLVPPLEVYANRPTSLIFHVESRARLAPHFLILFSLGPGSPPRLIPYLPAGGSSRGRVELMVPRRGRHRFSWAHLSSLFPVGFFHKGRRFPLDCEVLVYPELFPGGTERPLQAGELGQGRSRRPGWGHDLHSLRAFRPGDDRRDIHWKRTARSGELILKEREAEVGRRLSIAFDNAVGELEDDAAELRFERLVSEAATAAEDYLKRGYEVELRTRDAHLPFAAGMRQRRRVLEHLALIAPRPRAAEPLPLGNDPAARLALAMDHHLVAEAG